MCAFISEEKELIEKYEEMWVSYPFIFKLNYNKNVLTVINKCWERPRFTVSTASLQREWPDNH